MTATGTPTVGYGDPVPAPLHHDPHEGTGLMLGPVVLLAGLAVVGGLLDLPFKRIEFLDEWLDPVFGDVSHHIGAPPSSAAPPSRSRRSRWG